MSGHMVVDISVLSVVLISSTRKVIGIVPRVGIGAVMVGKVVGISLRSSLGLSRTLLTSEDVASMTAIGTIVPRVGIVRRVAVVGKVVGIGVSLRSCHGFRSGLRCSYGLTPLASQNVSSIAEPAVVGGSSVVVATIVSVSRGLGSGLRLSNSRSKQSEKNLNKDTIKSLKFG